MEIKHAGDNIDDNPYKPLFQVLARQGPNAHDAEGRGESIGDGDSGVGEVRQYKVYGQPCRKADSNPRESRVFGHVADGQVGGFLLVAHPCDEAIDGHGEVVELHAAVGVKSFLIVQYDAQRLHHETHDPHPDAGLVFQKNISQTEGGGGDVEPVG